MIEEMRQSLTEFFDSKDREWYRRGIHQLEEQWKKTIEEMRQSLTELFDSKDREWYRRETHQLEELWKKVIESGGEYFDY
uniref:Uncharacterized protein n=1 Tax=Acrobeloides nanus TaxID=290746 RepID=A0A914DX18_9BILA